MYEISIDGQVYKYGKADMTNIAASGKPRRLETQLNSLRAAHPHGNISGRVLVDRPIISTRNIKAIETRYVQKYIDLHKRYPKGNLNHPSATF